MEQNKIKVEKVYWTNLAFTKPYHKDGKPTRWLRMLSLVKDRPLTKKEMLNLTVTAPTKPTSSHVIVQRMRQAGLITYNPNTYKYTITKLGQDFYNSIA